MDAKYVDEVTLRVPKEIKEKWGLEKDSYILYLARIVPEKGLHYLLDAFKEIDTDKKLVIAGGASHTNEYLDEIKKKASEDKRVIMTGFVQGDVLDELYSNCFLYCLPSDLEGMPISLMEAMSYGCNVLTSDIEECVQVSGEYGNTFKKGEISDLKMRLKQIEDNKKEDCIKISDYMIKKYNWEEVVERTEKLYECRK